MENRIQRDHNHHHVCDERDHTKNHTDKAHQNSKYDLRICHVSVCFIIIRLLVLSGYETKAGFCENRVILCNVTEGDGVMQCCKVL